MLTKTSAWGIVGAICLSTAGASADTVTLSASKDNTLYQEEFGELSNGLGAYFFAGVNGQGEIRRGLIAFDASSIPAGATITSATLRLRMSRTIDAAQPVSLHRMLQDWGEGTSNAAANEGGGIASTPGDATWIHAFYDATPWTDENSQPIEGGRFELLPSATVMVDQIAVYSWSGPEVGQDVQRWVDSPVTNFGWLVMGFENGLSSAKRFDSRNNLTPANRPQLVIEFTPPSSGCPCDLNMDNAITSGDFFDFLTAFFEGNLIADFDDSGEVNSADFFMFLTCFFAPPAECR